MKADRNVRSDLSGSLDEAPCIRGVAIDLQQRPDGGGGVRRASAKSRGNGDVFLEAELPADRDAEPGSNRALGFQDKVLAIDKAREWPFEAEAVP